MALDVSLAEKSPAKLGVVVAAVAVVYFAAYQLLLKPLYNLFFHPLRHYPGPKLWAAYRIPYARSAVSGKHHQNIHELHLRYGDIVRVSPTELSYTRADAWKEIMGHRKKGQSENGKDPKFFRMGQVGIFPSDRERHSLHRRILGPGFSTKSMAAQQPLIQHYIDLLFRKIRESAAHSSIDIMSWYNYTTFDIIGDLAFGEPFGCLENSALNSWVSIIFESMRELNLIIALRPFFPNIDAFIMKLFPSAVVKDQERRDLGNAKIDKRMSLTTQRHDFMDSMMNKDAKGSLSKEEIYENSQGLIAAGSETTATALTFVTYFLCKHPHVLAKLRAEVDAHFTDESEIDMTRVQSLTYMLAVIDETMRLYPVVPTTPPRLSPPEGQEICGRFVPGNTTLTISQWAMFRNPENFTKPEEFIPERFLEGSRFANDRMEAFQPFSTGARDCIGKNLAYTEMRTILARLVFNFDIALDDRSKDWGKDLDVFFFWDKPPLYVNLTPRRGQA